MTLGEDIADLGIRLAYLAYFKNTPEGRKRRNDMDERKMFFESFAQIWCRSLSQEKMCLQVNDDSHAVAKMRVDSTLRQIPEFREAYGCGNEDRMVNPKPCRIYG